MQTLTFKTNLTCGGCVSAVKPLLDAESSISSWHVETDSPEKPLTVEGDGIGAALVAGLVARAGFQAIPVEEGHPGRHEHRTSDGQGSFRRFYPLALILAYLVGVVTLLQWRPGQTGLMRAMNDFMAGFFLAFSFFKVLDLRGFASAYSSYDAVARRWLGYGYVYPFIELGLGIAYLLGFRPALTNLATLVVMAIGSVGVVQALRAKRKIPCACLGSIFDLPMTMVTVIEDLLMAGMAAGMLLAAAVFR